MRHVLHRTLWSERRDALGWILGVLGLVGVTAGSWPAVEGSSADLEQLLGDLPPALTALFGEGITSFSAASVVGSRLFGSIGLIVAIGYAVSRGARSLAGEEGDGTMELLVTQPISRARIATAKLTATWLGLAVLVLVQQVALLAISPGVGLDFGLGAVAAASLGLYLLAALFGMLAYATGALTGNRGRAVAVAGGSAAALFLLAGLAQLIPDLEALARWSPFARYDGTLVLTDGLDVPAMAVVAVVALALAVAGTAIFERRDLT